MTNTTAHTLTHTKLVRIITHNRSASSHTDTTRMLHHTHTVNPSASSQTRTQHLLTQRSTHTKLNHKHTPLNHTHTTGALHFIRINDMTHVIHARWSHEVCTARSCLSTQAVLCQMTTASALRECIPSVTCSFLATNNTQPFNLNLKEMKKL